MFYLLAERGTEGKIHLLERRNNESSNSEVGKDFMNFQSGEDAKMPGGWWKRCGVTPANRAVGGTRSPKAS